MREHLRQTYKAISDLAAGGAASRAVDALAHSRAGEAPRGKPAVRDDGNEGGVRGADEVKAKQEAFLARAKAGDPALHEELAKSTDAKGLQRAIGAMTGRIDDLARMFTTDTSKYPKALALLRFTKQAGENGLTRTQIMRSKVFRAAMPEIRLGNQALDPAAVLLLDTHRHQLDQVVPLLRADSTIPEILRLLKSGQVDLKSVLEILNFGNQAPA